MSWLTLVEYPNLYTNTSNTTVGTCIAGSPHSSGDSNTIKIERLYGSVLLSFTTTGSMYLLVDILSPMTSSVQ